MGLEALGGAAGGGGLDDDGVAGMDREDGLGVRGVVAPGYRRGGGEEGVGGLGLGLGEEGRGDGGEEKESAKAHAVGIARGRRRDVRHATDGE